jgi:hypothetical protein
MNAAARKALADRDARLVAHAREGLRLAREEPAYHAAVLARLGRELGRDPEDLWDAIPWTWAVALDGEPPRAGAMATAVVEAARLLRSFLGGEEPLEVLEARWSATAAAPLGLGSTLRSHPFPDLRAWSIRPVFAASSSTPRGS